jgi:hypothetical protein
VQALGQVSHEKDRCAAKILTERASSERALQDVQTESLKTQAQLQAQLAKRLQLVQEEFQQRLKEQLEFSQKEKDGLIIAQALETEKQADRFKHEMKRNQVNELVAVNV